MKVSTDWKSKSVPLVDKKCIFFFTFLLHFKFLFKIFTPYTLFFIRILFIRITRVEFVIIKLENQNMLPISFLCVHNLTRINISFWKHFIRAWSNYYLLKTTWKNKNHTPFFDKREGNFTPASIMLTFLIKIQPQIMLKTLLLTIFEKALEINLKKLMTPDDQLFFFCFFL